MLRSLFPKYYPRYEGSCCVDELVKFGRWLLNIGYSRKNTCGHLRRFQYVFELANQPTADATFTVAQLTSLFAAPKRPAYRFILNTATRRAYQRFLPTENRLVLINKDSPLCIASLDDYEQFLRGVCSFTENTTVQHRSELQSSLFGACTQPFRHSFAVQALIRLYQRTDDVQSGLAHLALYMGHVSIVSTAYYLHFVPTLAAMASDRFERCCGNVL